jgi:Xaa-Pro aminopeptidase
LARQQRLRSVLEKQGTQSIVVSNLTNVYYLTGFRGSAGLCALGTDRAMLFVDPRYTLQAHEQAQGVEVHEHRGRLIQGAAKWLEAARARTVGYDDRYLTCAGFRELEAALPKRCALRPVGGLVEELRAVKDPTEVGYIREAARLTSTVFEEVSKHLRPGLRESDLAAEIEYRLRKQRAEGVAFETIVASGARSAFPHARPSSKLLKKNELVIFDLGAIISGYAADMTRTVFLGRPDQRVKRLYNAVLDAQRHATAKITAGRRAGAVDSAARRELARRGLGRYFTHSTGHGVGLDIHEQPRLAKGERTLLPAGCVVTVEPGIYLEGLGGIRIEDTVLVNEGGSEVLTSAPKDDWIIP